MAWKSNYDNMAMQMQQHCELQQQHATNLQYNLQYEAYQELYTNKNIEFHDPWEDYYSQQETNADIASNEGATQTQPDAVYGNGNEYEENKWEVEQGKQDEIEQSQSQHHHQHHEEQQQQQQETQTHLDFVRQQEAKEQEITTTSRSSCEFDLVTAQSRDDKENDNRKQELTETETHHNEMENNNSSPNTTRSSSTESNKIQEQKHNNTGSHDNSVCEQNDEKLEEAGLAGALSHLRLGEPRSPEQDAYEQLMRRQCWESGQVDYAGRDAFDNIWKKITHTLESKPDKTGSS